LIARQDVSPGLGKSQAPGCRQDDDSYSGVVLVNNYTYMF